jgi:hypothetical protein
LTEPSTESDAALPAADDEDVRLHAVAELLLLHLLLLGPVLGVGIRAVHGTLDSGLALPLLVSLEFLHRRQQRPRHVVTGLGVRRQTQMSLAAARRRLECDPRRDDAVCFVGGLGGVKSRRVGIGEPFTEHVGDAVPALDRLEVPGERDEIAPEAADGEHAGNTRNVPVDQGVLELRQPGVDPFLRGVRAGDRVGLDGLGHENSLR